MKDVFCPICEQRGRKKLLFQTDKAKGLVIIRCRGCKEIVRIKLEELEPVSREF